MGSQGKVITPSNQKSSMETKKAPVSASKPVKTTSSQEWKDVPVVEHKKEQAAKHQAKISDWASSGAGAQKRKEHGPFYAAKHSAEGQTHGPYYADKHKSSEQLAKEKAARQEQWVKDNALQNKRDAEAKYERTMKAKKNKASYESAKSAGTLSSEKADKEHGPFYAKKHATPAVAKASPVVNIAAPVTPKAAPESAIGEGVDAPVRYDNEIGKGKCLQRAVNFVCVEWTDCVIKPTAMPTHHPVPHPTARPTYMVPTLEPTPRPSTTDDCDPNAEPCKHDFLAMCYEYYHCEEPGNHDHYPDAWYQQWYNWFSGNGTHPDELNTTSTEDEDDFFGLSEDDEGESEEGEGEEGDEGDKSKEAPEEHKEAPEEPKEAPEEPKEEPKDGGEKKEPCEEDDDAEDNDVAMPVPTAQKNEKALTSLIHVISEQ